MGADVNGAIDYSCRRQGTEHPARYPYRGVGAAREAHPESLEFFLLERYYLYSQRDASLIRSQVSHAPYRIRKTDVEISSSLPPAQWIQSPGSRRAGLLCRRLRC
jgi:uncharacterized protein YqjF (DUF2071 family)